MHVLAIRRPGPRGTQKLVSRFGHRLVCVRYRYDAGAVMRYKTVELIIEQAAGTPPRPHPHAQEPGLRVHYIDDLPEPPRAGEAEVGVKIFYRENALRDRATAAGARGSKGDRVWMPYETAVSLGLEHRIAKR